MDSDVRVVEVRPHFVALQMRTPLKFGAQVMTRTTYCQVKVAVETLSGRHGAGWGGICLADTWAFPSEAVPHEQREAAMRRVVDRFGRAVQGHPAHAHPIDLFHDLEGELRKIGQEVSQEMALAEPLPFLAALVAASPIDAAIHDAFGNANEICTYDGYGRDHMHHDLSRYLGRKLKGRYVANFIRKKYALRLPVFHLVGGLDKLRRSELDEADPKDGHPVSLDDWVQRDHLTCLKIKLRGNDAAWDLNRIEEIARVAHRAQEKIGLDELHLTADFNEQCQTPDYVIEVLTKLKERAPYACDELLYVEQPTPRDLRAHPLDMHKAAALKPIILDEGLVSLEDFDLALKLGWSGVALKTCKTQSAALIAAAKAEAADIPYTIQDLSNPALALIQSVGLAARLEPIRGVEANARQFYPDASAPEAAVHHGVFNVRDGMVSTTTIHGSGLGYRIDEIHRRLA